MGFFLYFIANDQRSTSAVLLYALVFFLSLGRKTPVFFIPLEINNIATRAVRLIARLFLFVYIFKVLPEIVANALDPIIDQKKPAE